MSVPAVGADLRHLTVNSGGEVRVVRDAVGRRLIDHLGALVDKGGGDFGEFRFTIIERVSDAGQVGAASFQMSDLGEQLILSFCLVCWSDPLSDETWSGVLAILDVLRDPLRDAGLYPEAVPSQPFPPWLATLLLPGFATLSEERREMLTALERSVACTMIEHSGPRVHH